MRSTRSATPQARPLTFRQRAAARFAALLALAVTLTETRWAAAKQSPLYTRTALWRDTSAMASVGNIGSVALIIVGSILAAVVGMSVLASLAPQFFTDLASLVGVFNDANTTTGDTTGDAFLPIAALVLSIVGALAIFGIALGVLKIRNSRS